MMKALVKYVCRFLATPWRLCKQHKYRDGHGDIVQRTEIANEILLPMVREAIGEGNTCSIYVKGYSMRPFLEHLRDQVDLAPVGDLHVGDAVLAEITPLHFVLHRIIAIDGEHITLMGDGNIRGTEHCRRCDVCGIVTQYIRPGGHIIRASDPRLRRRIRLWRRLLPLRRYLLFIYKLSV